ncbi:MAG: hypothetical protein QG670_378 [Thermoproteota archaeon]|nr:hypothetical protein [Thermoproteota archaeon]
MKIDQPRKYIEKLEFQEPEPDDDKLKLDFNLDFTEEEQTLLLNAEEFYHKAIEEASRVPHALLDPHDLVEQDLIFPNNGETRCSP